MRRRHRDLQDAHRCWDTLPLGGGLNSSGAPLVCCSMLDLLDIGDTSSSVFRVYMMSIACRFCWEPGPNRAPVNGTQLRSSFLIIGSPSKTQCRYILDRFFSVFFCAKCSRGIRSGFGLLTPYRALKPFPILFPSSFVPKKGFQTITSLGPQNHSLYYFRVVLSRRRVSSCKGVKGWLLCTKKRNDVLISLV